MPELKLGSMSVSHPNSVIHDRQRIGFLHYRNAKIPAVPDLMQNL